jgi:hypothetical protein
MANVILKRKNLTQKRVKKEIQKILARKKGNKDAYVHVIITKKIHAGLTISKGGVTLCDEKGKGFKLFSRANIDSMEFRGKL